MADTFVPSQFFRLHNLIQRAIAAPSSSAGTSNEWYIAVDGLRNELVDLGRVKAGDNAELKEIESGKITLGSTTHTLNSDFASLTILLATNLNISAKYCASLLQDALSSRSRYPSRSPIEIALVLHQRERWALTEAWKELVSAAVTLPQEADVSQRRLGLKMNQAVQALLGLKVSYADGTGRRDVSLLQRILLEIDSLKSQANAVENALRNPPSDPNRRLPDELQLERISTLGQERRAWAHVLYLLAISAMLQGEEILAMAKWLSKVKEDEATGVKEDLMPYVLTALLAALETSTKASLEGLVGAGQPDLLDDRTSLSQMDTLINKSGWASLSLQAVVQLQWSLLLVKVVKHDASLGNELNVSEDSVSRAVLKAIQQGDAFIYLVLRLLGWRQRLFDAIEGTEDEDALSGAASAQAQSTQLGVDAGDEIDIEFQPYLLSSLHSLLLGISRTFLSLLRKLQRQEEDAAYSVLRPGSKDVRRYDLEAFLDGLALVVRGDASKSLSFWLTPEGRRSRFVMWAVELREEGHQRALLDLLSAMSTGGSEGAWQAHALLSSSAEGGAADDGLISWNRLWDWMAYYVDALRGGGDRERASMPPGEMTLLRSFLRLLRSVVSGSYAAREAILALTLNAANPGTSVLQRLFALYVCPIPIELKATLLDTMAAFARENGLTAGTAASARLPRVRQELWSLVESSGILSGPHANNRNVAAARFGGLGGSFRAAQAPPSDVLFELENVEAASGFYPGTVSFINFLSALVVPEFVGPGGRAGGDVGALVADLPLAGPLGQQPSLPLGVPQSLGSAASAHQGSGHGVDVGLEKYITFVVDSVLLPSLAANGPRDFAALSEKWRLISSCLHFLHRCLSAFDLSSLTRTVGVSAGNGQRGAEDRETLLRLAMHPGFGVMKRLMSTSKLLKEILALLSPNMSGQPIPGLATTAAGYEIVDSPAAKRSAIFLPAAVGTAMRIILAAIKGQGLFLQVLLPTLAGLSDSAASGAAGPAPLFPGLDLDARIGQSSSYTPIDNKMLQEYESVVQIALYVNSVRDDLALLSVKLLTEVANGAAFSEVDRFADGSGGAGRRRMNRLVGLLEMTEESGRVREGVVRRLDALAGSDDEGEAVPRGAGLDDAEEDSSEEQLLGIAAPSSCGNAAVCRAILELLLIGTSTSKHAPNLAHLLLGYDLRAVRAEDQVIPSPSPESPRGGLHALLDLLRGDRDLAEDETAEALEQGVPSLLETHPALAERTLALLLNLCTHPYTTSCTLRYLRTQEDFWAKQLRNNFFAYTVPVERGLHPQEDEETSSTRLARGQLVFADGRSTQTSVDALISSLNARQHLLSGVAIELHGLVTAGMQSQAAHLVGALYGTGLVLSRGRLEDGDEDFDESAEDFMQAQASAVADRDVGMRLLTLLQSFDFEWHDERDGLASQLVMLRDLDVSQAKAPPTAGGRQFDISKTIALLAFARRELERMGELGDARRRANFDAEAAIVLQHVSARNAHRAVAKCRRSALASWRNVQDLVLAHGEFLLRPEAQPLVVFDSLSALLPRLDGAAPEEDPVLADLAAGAILSLLTSLRRHRAQAPVGAGLTDELPIDRLLSTLAALTGAILRAGTSVSARGNLYSALINYLQLVRAAANTNQGGEYPLGASGDSLVGDDSFSYADGESLIGSSMGGASAYGGGDYQQPSSLDSRTRTFLAQHAERLVPVLARDALDAPDVWRTVAFTLLDRLCALESTGRSKSGRSPVVLDILTRHGYLKSFVARLRDMDLPLQSILRPDPPSLNALYVYEAKLAFFGRLASSRRGAERLLEAKLFDTLCQADFLAARPEEDQDFVDLESFLPAATERYAALLTPALQVAVAVVQATTGGPGRSRSEAHAPGSATSRNQALSLLNAHRESLLAVLRSAVQDTVSLSTVDEAHLVVTLMLQVLPILDDEALVAPRPLAAYHSAILQAAAGFLHSTAWRGRVLPFTEREREEEATTVGGGTADMAMDGDHADGRDLVNRGEESVFDQNAARSVSRLIFSLTSYLEAASEPLAGRQVARPCLSSSLAVPQPYQAGRRGRTPGYDSHDDLRRSRGPDGASTRVASVPSLGIALAAMDEQVASLEQDLPLAERLRSMLDEGENVGLQEWEALTGSAATRPDVGSLQLRRSALVLAKLGQMRGKATQRLDVVDVLIVVIQRHFAYYLAALDDESMASSSGIGAPPQGVDAGYAAPWMGGRQNVPTTNKAIGTLAADSTSGSSIVSNARERSTFLELVGRKLQTMLLVRQEAEEKIRD
ncbi:hypothetical protein BDZ90DRAFT_216572 [Jaminaea rosea]|uniref:Nucleoporin n=1 Tax=Jaminaea rosea TaxID=1569628 RepID=A0A316UVT1_9BASI|nr:hypothetical protein BDZ90DRAFT_216572 [Jaminaea rosea]PWN29407.1 hypothetical protein BDZ90DRAFT_216572 [Jaminaea rosea]